MKPWALFLVVALTGGLMAADELVPETHGNAVPAFVVFDQERHQDLSFLVDRCKRTLVFENGAKEHESVMDIRDNVTRNCP